MVGGLLLAFAAFMACVGAGVRLVYHTSILRALVSGALACVILPVGALALVWILD
jgi:hypothetical protein